MAEDSLCQKYPFTKLHNIASSYAPNYDPVKFKTLQTLGIA